MVKERWLNVSSANGPMLDWQSMRSRPTCAGARHVFWLQLALHRRRQASESALQLRPLGLPRPLAWFR